MKKLADGSIVFSGLKDMRRYHKRYISQRTWVDELYSKMISVWEYIRFFPWRLKNCYQILVWDFCDYEVMDTDHSMATFILPRLDRLMSKRSICFEAGELEKDYPEIRWALLRVGSADIPVNVNKALRREKRIDRGLLLLGKHFRYLWY